MDNPTEMIEVRLPKIAAVGIHQFLTMTIKEMKESSSAVEWDTLEVKTMVEVLNMLIKQLPEELS